MQDFIETCLVNKLKWNKTTFQLIFMRSNSLTQHFHTEDNIFSAFTPVQKAYLYLAETQSNA